MALVLLRTILIKTSGIRIVSSRKYKSIVVSFSPFPIIAVDIF